MPSNQITVTGNLGSNPIYRNEPGYNPTLSFSVFQNRSKKVDMNDPANQNNPNVKDGRLALDPCVFNCKLVGGLATALHDKFESGMAVMVTGSLAPNQYIDPETQTNVVGFTLFADMLSLTPFNCSITRLPKQQAGQQAPFDGNPSHQQTDDYAQQTGY